MIWFVIWLDTKLLAYHSDLFVLMHINCSQLANFTHVNCSQLEMKRPRMNTHSFLSLPKITVEHKFCPQCWDFLFRLLGKGDDLGSHNQLRDRAPTVMMMMVVVVMVMAMVMKISCLIINICCITK